VCCSVLQCVAVCCSVLQCVAGKIAQNESIIYLCVHVRMYVCMCMCVCMLQAKAT